MREVQASDRVYRICQQKSGFTHPPAGGAPPHTHYDFVDGYLDRLARQPDAQGRRSYTGIGGR